MTDEVQMQRLRDVLDTKDYKSLKEWKLDNYVSYRIACTLGRQRQLAEEYGLNFYSKCGSPKFEDISYGKLITELKKLNVRTTSELRCKFTTLYRCLCYRGELKQAIKDLNLTRPYVRRK